MPREMWCIIHSSYSLGFPWWEVRSRSWNVIPKLFKICTHAHEDSVCWWCWLWLHVCVCSGKQPAVTVSRSILTSRWSILGRRVLPASWPHWGATACDNSCALSWAVISDPSTEKPLATPPSLGCASGQQEAPACLWALQPTAASWSSVLGQVCSHSYLLGVIACRLRNHEISCLNAVHTLLFSRTSALAGTGTVDLTPLGSLPCPEEGIAQAVGAGAARATL